ncbi:DUF3109 family protein [Flavihumibacter petaseus]|uniref:DUF3109 family protein n=1 Tax=Flavihumibacter petaseus NBRC 106054 TaxID=1220578 RepID=A0A0E9MVQ0_9BACT|nr:DUF3109 family protein [Flavihumibacter petaseus]GAO41832.1 hypothetical protein FPE01S_01_08470 [Flavihumibacter petaseus NBRC 106054]
MIAIEHTLVSDEIVQEKFVCDLARCKGGCCEDGDTGAPLDTKELDIINQVYEIVKPYLTKAGIRNIEKNGRYQYDKEFGWVTPANDDGICAYGYRDAQGIIKCAFEQAYNDGKIDWKKPISCHLFPIRVKVGREYELLNYEPRETLCSPACALGKKLKVPVYQFLKEPLIRKYGQEYYDALDAYHHTFVVKK